MKQVLEKGRGTETKSRAHGALSRFTGKYTMKWRWLRIRPAKTHTTHYTKVFPLSQLGKGWEQSFEGWRNHGFKHKSSPWRRLWNEALPLTSNTAATSPRSQVCASPMPERPLRPKGLQPGNHQVWGLCHHTTAIWPGGTSVECAVNVWDTPYRAGNSPGDVPSCLKQEKGPPWEADSAAEPQAAGPRPSCPRRGAEEGSGCVSGPGWPCWGFPSQRLSLWPRGHRAVQQGKPPQISTASAARHHLGGGGGRSAGCNFGLKRLNQTSIPLQATKSFRESGPQPFHLSFITYQVGVIISTSKSLLMVWNYTWVKDYY